MIYFARASNGTGLIKIGYAIDPRERLKEIQRMSPVSLIILQVISGGRKKEALLHKHFSEFRQHGEWFEPNDELFELISDTSLVSGIWTKLESKRQPIDKPRPIRDKSKSVIRSSCGRKTIGFRLREMMARKSNADKKKCTYEVIQKATGISPNTLSRMGQNKMAMMNLSVVDRLVEYLGCELDELIVGGE